MRTCFTIFLFAAGLAAAANPDFSGNWEFVPARSQNVGMMAQMKIAVSITQTPSELRIVNRGKEQSPATIFNLAAKPVANETPMGEKAETVSKWQNGKLVTTWTSPGSVAGTQTVRTETRSLSSDGRTMTVESARGKNPPMTMIFERK